MTPIYAMLQPKDSYSIAGFNPTAIKVLELDPTEFYQRIKIDPFSRIQTSKSGLSLTTLFPNPAPNICACGCGKSLTGRKHRWDSEKCSHFALIVLRVIRGHADTIKALLHLYNGGRCCQKCGIVGEALELDHVIPVHKGGGGCWLNNYQLLCKSCHLEKSIAERKALAA